jgi:hypothetical protein
LDLALSFLIYLGEARGALSRASDETTAIAIASLA